MTPKTVPAHRKLARVRRRATALPPKKPTVRVVSLALRSLELLCKSGRGIGVRELSRTLGIGKSTMHRILQTLEAHSFVHQDRETARYVVTAHLMELAAMITEGLQFRRVARPFLEGLQERSGETVFLGVLDSSEVVIVERIDSAKLLRMTGEIGSREPVYSTALGKALLAGLSEEELESRLRGFQLKAFTAKTISSLDSLKSELKRARLSGFAIDDEETMPGVLCVGAPIRDTAGRVIAAVSVSGPSLRITTDRIPTLAQDVRSTAEIISRELGYCDETPVFSLTAEETEVV